jgi:PleD family two-component response regulator
MSQIADPTGRAQQTLLVVDDHPLNILVLYQALSADYRVLKASGGAEALQVCRTQRPDLVLLDIAMPGMDGFEVCRQLKADPLTRDIPVIFVTAHNDTSHETLGLEMGAVDFIVKPINAAVVRARVKTHLSFARSSSLLAATLEASTDGVLVADLASGISSMNQALIRM